MIIQNPLPQMAMPTSRNGLLREFVVRRDRIPLDERVDMPEIQESFRVALSDEAVAAKTEGELDPMRKSRATDEGHARLAQLRLYETISRL